MTESDQQKSAAVGITVCFAPKVPQSAAVIGPEKNRRALMCRGL